MPPGRDRGFALLIVLWGIVLLAMLGTGITASGRTDVQLATNIRDAAEAEAAADGAVFAAAYHLLDPVRPWRAGAGPYTIETARAHVTIWIADDAGKINPNTASPELLRSLLLVLGTESDSAGRIAAAIADWRFTGTLPRQNGAKAPQYRAAGLAYGPPNTPFESLDELGIVLGVTPAVLAKIAPHLSLYNDRPVVPAAADDVVRRALRATFGPPGPEADNRLIGIVTIVARAETVAGSRFVRQTTFRFGTAAREPLFETLIWRADPE